ncbi:MAG: RHS repeat protein [Alphaproteobacteria bacterium]|nr:RHS repeat protein [Alphaproteobacteria bacterium]
MRRTGRGRKVGTAAAHGCGALAAFLGLAHAQSVSYTYDALGRLTSATYSDGRVIEYAYDPAGGRTAVEKTGVTNGAPDAADDTRTVILNTATTFDPRTAGARPGWEARG